MEYKELIEGTVVMLPEDIQGLGIVINARHIRTNYYEAIIILDDGDVMLAKIRTSLDDVLDYKEYHIYDTREASRRLIRGKYTHTDCTV